MYGTDHLYKKAKEIGVKTAFGTDLAFDPVATANQGKMLAKLGRHFTSHEALKMATSTNAELLKLCGPRNPYRDGDLALSRRVLMRIWSLSMGILWKIWIWL